MAGEASEVRGGPTALSERAAGPDLARGAMLLLIALANTHLYLHGHLVGVRYYPAELSGADTAVAWLLMTAVDGRAYPMFGLLFGYGLAQLLRRLDRAGTPPGAALGLLRRRARWLLLLGLLHALLLFSGDILGAYGVLGLLLAGTVVRAGDRRLLVLAALWVVPVLVLNVGQGVPLPPDTTTFLPSMATTDPLAAAGLRLVEWVGLTLFMAGSVAVVVLLGAWAGRRRLLDEPERHRRVLRTGAVVGLGVGVLGAQPFALMASQLWPDPSLPALLLAAVLHTATGYAAGVGYACVGGLVAARLRGRRGPVSGALVATGQRSLTCYLAQSVVLVALLASYGGGLGDRLGVAQATGVAVLTWLATVVLAVLLARAGRRGPAEVLLRRLTYGPTA